MDSKPWFKSKTIVFFLLYAAVNVAGRFGWLDWSPTPDQAEIVAVLVSGIGVALRYITRTPIGA